MYTESAPMVMVFAQVSSVELAAAKLAQASSRKLLPGSTAGADERMVQMPPKSVTGTNEINASRMACAPLNAGSSAGWMFTIRPP